MTGWAKANLRTSGKNIEIQVVEVGDICESHSRLGSVPEPQVVHKDQRQRLLHSDETERRHCPAVDGPDLVPLGGEHEAP